jgi:hypothetical protein
MRLTIDFVTEDDDGNEIQHQLPANYVVCSGCQGHGTHLNPSIGQHAFTAEEFERDFDEEQRAEYCRRGGIYDVQCTTCIGLRVVPVVDREACTTAEHKESLALYDSRENDRRQDDVDWAHEIRTQELMGGMRE